MTRLSVNINKIATLRNARGGNIPNVLEAAINCERFGAEGITVHPRPDERHIRYQDVMDIRPVLKTEFNVEGYPGKRFMELVLEVVPDQVTLVPDPPDTLTSNAGWQIKNNLSFLTEIVSTLHQKGIRTSIFVDTCTENLRYAPETGTDRIELYTEPYASNYHKNRDEAIRPFLEAARLAHSLGLGINAGHDLNLDNLKYFHQNIPHLAEVSIGHALISDALFYGLENTIQMYLRQLR
ncbi:MAG TPA: pyridoxine 5'-phosphate synthase [Bacteroidetes bacterium]|nr:pyridoxine 5'-phosphate synthase [Bacteroidota bacterium]